MTLETIYDGNGSLDDFNTNFDYLEQEDISVAVQPSGGSYATKTLDTHYTVSGQVVTFTSGNVPPNNSKVRIRRHTPVTQPRHTFYAGSTVTAKSLNDNTNQILNALEERGLAVDDETDQPFTIGTHNEIKVNSATNLEVVAGKITNNHMAINSIDSDQYVDGSIDRVHLAADIIDGTKINNDSIDSEHYVADSIDAEHYAPGSVDSTAIGNDQVNSQHYAAGSIDLEHMSSESVDEDNLHISNAGTNGDYLTKQSGNTGGLTWVTPNLGKVITFATANTTSSVTGSEDTWVDTGLTLNITPKSTSSTIRVTGYIYMFGKPKADSSGSHSGKFRLRLRVQPSGGSESTVGEEMLGTFGQTSNATYFHYVAQKEWQFVFHEEYANSTTTQKTFHIECEEQDNSIIEVNRNAGRSFINAMEVV